MKRNECMRNGAFNSSIETQTYRSKTQNKSQKTMTFFLLNRKKIGPNSVEREMKNTVADYIDTE